VVGSLQCNWADNHDLWHWLAERYTRNLCLSSDPLLLEIGFDDVADFDGNTQCNSWGSICLGYV